MLLSESVEIKLNYKNIDTYYGLGYEFEYFINKNGKKSVKRGTSIIVKVEDLDIGSGANIKYKCDYCGKEVDVRYCDYMRHYQNGIKKDKDCCSECIGIKTKEKLEEKYGKGVTTPFSVLSVREKRDNTVKERYGVNNVFKLDSVKDKSKETSFEKYGVEFYTQTDEYKKRSKETCIEKYGVDNVSKSQEIIDKIKTVQVERYGDLYTRTDECKEKYKTTMMELYGVENAFQSEVIKEKSKNTMIQKYGVPYLILDENRKWEILSKGMETKRKMDKLPSSRQQEYLHKIYGGIKNYIVGNCALDVALIDEKIDIEGDFSGHWLRIKLGDCTEEEFKQKELKRKYFLKSQGWKDFRIISRKDNLPNDYILLHMLCIAKEWFNDGHSWIKFDIDNGIYEKSNGIFNFDFGKLRKISDEDLKEA